jgi:hypothetical protein
MKLGIIIGFNYILFIIYRVKKLDIYKLFIDILVFIIWLLFIIQ